MPLKGGEESKNLVYVRLIEEAEKDYLPSSIRWGRGKGKKKEESSFLH